MSHIASKGHNFATGTAAAPVSQNDVSTGLPEWNLEDLYPGQDSAEFEADLSWLESECSRTAEAFRGRVSTLDAAELLQAIEKLEAIEVKIARISSFAELRSAEDTSDPQRGKFLGDCEERLAGLYSLLVFFGLEINGIDDERYEELLSMSTDLQRYRPLLDQLRKMRPHQLSTELEQYIVDRSVVSRTAWTRLFDETLAGMRFRFEGAEYTLEQALDMLRSHNRPLRKKSAAALARSFKKHLPVFTLITNTLAKEKAINDRWRRFPTPQASRHLANDVEAEVVEALKVAVTESYERISHRYFELKAQWLGLKRLEFWDRSAPLPFESQTRIGWNQARDTVLSAFGGFSPEMADIASRFFSNNWIDAPMKPGKISGAFSASTSTEVHPYILLNYAGRPRDVMVLAHELGHGVHQFLASSQGELLSQTPLTLAETASVFGEMLTFRELLKSTQTRHERLALLANKAEDMIDTVIRQIAFYEFESRLHERRSEGELTSDDIGAIWMQVQGESLGPAMNLAANYKTYWSYIPHFIHQPFYVYSYAFGHGLVHALYAEYESGQEGFQERYLDLLKAGGSRNYRDLLAPFGLDATIPSFWQKGLDFMETLIGELEETMT